MWDKGYKFQYNSSKIFCIPTGSTATAGVSDNTEPQLCGGCGTQRPSKGSGDPAKFCSECGCKYGGESSDDQYNVSKGKK